MNKRYLKGLVLLGVTLSMGLTSCQFTNKYKAPEVDTSNLYREAESSDTTSVANLPWRQYFSDPYLQALIEEGLANNYNMLITVERVKQAEASLSMARAAYLPSLGLNVGVDHERASAIDPITKVPQSSAKALKYHGTVYSLGLGASWEVDLWGKLNRQSRAKYAQLLNSYAGQELVQTSLVSSIANSYYTLLSMDEQLTVTRQMANLIEETLQTMIALRDAGELTSASVEQTRASLMNVRVSIPTLESSIRQVENSLSVALGRKPGSISRSTFAQQVVPTSLQYGVPAQMLANRPDVKQAETSFRAAFELTQAAQAAFYPSLTLNTGSYVGYGATSLSGFFKVENLAASIIGGLTQPIFAKKQLITQLKLAKGDQQIALYTFENTVLDAGREVSDIMYTFDSSLKKNELRTEQVEALTKSVDYTRDLLVAGESNYLEVITAQSNLLSAQLNQVSDKLEQLQAGVDLYRALGGGTK